MGLAHRFPKQMMIGGSRVAASDTQAAMQEKARLSSSVVAGKETSSIWPYLQLENVKAQSAFAGDPRSSHWSTSSRLSNDFWFTKQPTRCWRLDGRFLECKIPKFFSSSSFFGLIINKIK